MLLWGKTGGKLTPKTKTNNKLPRKRNNCPEKQTKKMNYWGEKHFFFLQVNAIHSCKSSPNAVNTLIFV